jgi:hypothetical protein
MKWMVMRRNHQWINSRPARDVLTHCGMENALGQFELQVKKDPLPWARRGLLWK